VQVLGARRPGEEDGRARKEGRRIKKANITSIKIFIQDKRKNTGILSCHMVPVSIIYELFFYENPNFKYPVSL